jgi:hypothetical protein
MDESNQVETSIVSVVCPIVGPHWERIGFQGLDPRTGDVTYAYTLHSYLMIFITD